MVQNIFRNCFCKHTFVCYIVALTFTSRSGINTMYCIKGNICPIWFLPSMSGGKFKTERIKNNFKITLLIRKSVNKCIPYISKFFCTNSRQRNHQSLCRRVKQTLYTIIKTLIVLIKVAQYTLKCYTLYLKKYKFWCSEVP